ncbi:hypothetical protein LIER_18239 [Lithospermum erythrorhizon]|uniref:Inosine/uridine-preferring nucleoside hydrolase domain-containing protein n=1 Tax=Lithospermum erythrorhizon TaxID=34254 RepID=A0AAV3QFU3_LITER
MFSDDTMAILMAFQNPDLDIIGMITIFGNVTTEYATRNALLLLTRRKSQLALEGQLAGKGDSPEINSLEPAGHHIEAQQWDDCNFETH